MLDAVFKILFFPVSVKKFSGLFCQGIGWEQLTCELRCVKWAKIIGISRALCNGPWCIIVGDFNAIRWSMKKG